MSDQMQDSGPFSASPRYARHWAWLTLTAVLVTPVFWLTDLDMTVARWFFHPTETDPWHLAQKPLWQLVNIGTPVLAIALGLGAITCILMATARLSWRPAARPAVFLLLTLVVGPGLLINGVFKEDWGRPRPRHVQLFGGEQNFLPPLKPNFGGPGTSFASGHASVGFSLATLWLLVPATRRRLSLTIFGTGIGVGILIGIGRFTDGAHFLSDVIWSGLLTYATALLVLQALDSRWGRKLAANSSGRQQRPLIAGVVAVLVVSLLAGKTLLSVPYDSTQSLDIPASDYLGKVIRVEVPRAAVRVTRSERESELRFTLMNHGYGLPNSEIRLALETESGEALNVRVARKGIFSRVHSLLRVHLPPDMSERMHIVVGEGNVKLEPSLRSATQLSIQVENLDNRYLDGD
jgi:membrane-associated PAP2 superfamily phosphatase